MREELATYVETSETDTVRLHTGNTFCKAYRVAVYENRNTKAYLLVDAFGRLWLEASDKKTASLISE